MTSKKLAETITDTDVANANRFAKQHGKQAAYSAARGWLFYDGKRRAYDMKDVWVTGLAIETAQRVFAEIADAPERDKFFRFAKYSQSKNGVTNMLNLAKPLSNIRTDINDFDTNKMALNCDNGTLDLLTGELKEHDPLDKITRLIPVDYKPDAECPVWLSFLDKIMEGNQNSIDYLQRAVGYSLTADTSDQVLFFLHGSGSNGKSVFIETLQAMFGDLGSSSRTDVIMKRSRGGIPNDVARLHGLRFVAMNETSEGQKMDEQVVKDITGGDTITARFLHQEFFDYIPTFKLWIRGNHKPVIHGTDDGIWRRIHMIPFAYQVTAQEKDPHIGEKLLRELAGILAWCVKGCMNWQKKGLKPPDDVLNAIEAYRDDSDTLGQFIEARCDVADGLSVSCAKLLQAYGSWADNEGVEKSYNKLTFAPALEAKGHPKSKRGSTGIRYVGLTIKPDESVMEQELSRWG